MNKHTPGPWVVEDDDSFADCDLIPIGAVDGARICDVTAGFLDDECEEMAITEETRANARLIAAAPTMLEALKDMVNMYVELVNSGDAGFWDPEKVPQVIQARAAIALAEGE